jgi:hypothetical protein
MWNLIKNKINGAAIGPNTGDCGASKKSHKDTDNNFSCHEP